MQYEPLNEPYGYFIDKYSGSIRKPDLSDAGLMVKNGQVYYNDMSFAPYKYDESKKELIKL